MRPSVDQRSKTSIPKEFHGIPWTLECVASMHVETPKWLSVLNPKGSLKLFRLSLSMGSNKGILRISRDSLGIPRDSLGIPRDCLGIARDSCGFLRIPRS